MEGLNYIRLEISREPLTLSLLETRNVLHADYEDDVKKRKRPAVSTFTALAFLAPRSSNQTGFRSPPVHCGS